MTSRARSRIVFMLKHCRDHFKEAPLNKTPTFKNINVNRQTIEQTQITDYVRISHFKGTFTRLDKYYLVGQKHLQQGPFQAQGPLKFDVYNLDHLTI